MKTTTKIRSCAVCSCTENDCSGCIRKTGRPCGWAGPRLCTACDWSAAELKDMAVEVGVAVSAATLTLLPVAFDIGDNIVTAVGDDTAQIARRTVVRAAFLRCAWNPAAAAALLRAGGETGVFRLLRDLRMDDEYASVKKARQLRSGKSVSNAD